MQREQMSAHFGELSVNRFDYRFVRQLMLFAASAQAGSIAKAAELLAVSPTPVIAQLDELETRIGVKLLSRTKRGVSLTPEGRAVLPTVLGLVAQVEAADYAVRLVKEGDSGIIKIGAVLEAMMVDVPRLLESLEKTHPGLSVFTEEIDSEEAVNKLSEGEMDLVIGRFERLPDPALKSACLRLEKPVVIFPAAHWLAKSEKTGVRLGELASEFWIVTGFEKGHHYWRIVDRLFEKAGFEPLVSQTVRSIVRQIAFTACRQGIAMIPEGCVETLPGSVKWLPLEDVPPVFPISIAWNEAIENPLRDEVIARAKQISPSA